MTRHKPSGKNNKKEIMIEFEMKSLLIICNNATVFYAQ